MVLCQFVAEFINCSIVNIWELIIMCGGELWCLAASLASSQSMPVGTPSCAAVETKHLNIVKGFLHVQSPGLSSTCECYDFGGNSDVVVSLSPNSLLMKTQPGSGEAAHAQGPGCMRDREEEKERKRKKETGIWL